MRTLRVVFLSALGMVAGCGGCDSCFGTAQPGDDAFTAPRADEAGVDAAAEAAPAIEDSGSDAAEAAARENTGPTQPLTAVPRPKSPMPLGAFQSCGVYDGPLCEKLCPKGACRQECDGVNCELTCKGGYCSQVCGPMGTCKLSCAGGHCVQVCTKAEGCVKECSGGSCE